MAFLQRMRSRQAFAALAWLGLSACQAPATRGEEPAYGRHQFDDSEAGHWAFIAPQRPEIPQPADATWSQTPVDAFILAELESQGIKPAAKADKRTLLRRAYLDLIGLPPTLEEQAAFLSDDSPDAFAKLVDRLLARPEYGERWGRHWLDVVRYAESNGYERDNPKPHAWRYRDYVIDAVINDKPFDRFVMEQIAGDELADTNADTQTATTFLRLGPWDDEPADPMIDRYDQLDDVLGTTAATFMGLTIRCARCHDHKYEPFKQQDYARLLAVFEPLKRPQNGRTDLDRMVGTPEELSSFETAVKRIEEHVTGLNTRTQQLKGELQKRLFETKQTKLPEDAVAAFATEADKRNESQKKLVQDFSGKLAEEIMTMASEQEREQLKQWEQEVQQAQASKPDEPPRAYVWFEDSPQAPLARVFHRGDPRSPREEVAPGLPAVLVDAPPPAPEPTAKSSGRRKRLAEWLVRRDNPLTARVYVNRVWQRHFGEGLVATENDFGLMGEAPTNEALLDWLAVTFVEGGWQTKPLHRLIMLSNAYQQSVVPAANETDPAGDDPEVKYLWRWRPRRLEAEAIRDSILSVAGQLNPSRGGPSVFPKISEAVLAGQSIPGNGWKASDPREANRRSVYVFVKRTLPVPELEVLDAPNTNASCEQRVISTVAPQALTYLNGEFIQEQAKHFARRLVDEVGADRTAQIERAYALALCRPPQDAERAAVLEFLDAQRQQIEADGRPQQVATNDAPAAEAATATAAPTSDAGATGDNPAAHKALEAFCLVLLSTNEFVYLQ